jgi:23S rRNA (adenine1618-N6)-methyltransferase
MLNKEQKEPSTEKVRLHPRSAHRERYNFADLIACCPELEKFVSKNKYNDLSIDFTDAEAVKFLNKSLLMHFYNIKYYDIPDGYLIAPVPGRADYIHNVADILMATNNGILPEGSKVNCLDIGTGANCIYPLIGNKAYGWQFTGSDIDKTAISNAEKITSQNNLQSQIDCRLQLNDKNIFFGVIRKNEFFDITICNPPFHQSMEDAQSGTLRKLKNLNKTPNVDLKLNFAGQSNELWCEGGERIFIKNLVDQSKQFKDACMWFSTLVSKEANVKRIQEALSRIEAMEVKTIPMGQGNKSSRIIAWTFMNKAQQKEWSTKYWSSNRQD